MSFGLGLAVGSFLNVVISRLGKGESIIFGRSLCPHCRHPLGARELIPLISYIALAGRCRFCHTHISLQYPLVELFTGLLFLMLWFRFSDSPFDFVFWLFFAASCIIIAVYDIKSNLIPSEIVWPLLVGGIAWRVMPLLASQMQAIEIVQAFKASFLTGGFISLLVLVTREQGMGKGDIPVAFLQGLLLGLQKGLFALALSFIIGAALSIVLLAIKKATLKSKVPFTPFLILSLFVVLFLET